MGRDAVIGIVVALLGAYAVLLIGLAVYARRHPDVVSLSDAIRLGPDLLRLVRRLATDRTVPRRTRILLIGLALYLLLPIDLVPDVLPVIGYADDVVLVALVLRAVVRQSGAETLDRHWPGPDGGLRVIRALAGLGESVGGIPGTGEDPALRNTA